MRTVSVMPFGLGMIWGTKAKRLAVCLCFALVLTLSLLLPGLSLGEARYPQVRGAVTDDANALSKDVAEDIASFQTLAKSRTGVTVYVALVHFLDGEDAQTYANTLFSRWGLGENDLLLLGAVGEDVFATASGKALKAKFSDANAQSLLFASGFGEMFKEQQYDGAMSHYFEAFSDMLSKQYGAEAYLGKLFSSHLAAAESTPEPAHSGMSRFSLISDMWQSAGERLDDTARNYEAHHSRQERESRGMGSAGWIVLLLLAVLIFGQRRTGRFGGSVGGNRGCMGCGCSPLGWLFSILGMGFLFGRKSP